MKSFQDIFPFPQQPKQIILNQDFKQLFTNFDIENNNLFNIIFVTDPPYNQNFKYDIYKDKLKNKDYIQLLSKLNIAPRIIIHYPEETINILPQAFPDEKCLDVLTWIYNGNQYKHSRSISFWGIKPNYNLVKQPYKNPTDKRIKERIKNGSQGARSYDWFNIPQVKNVSKEKTKHPCQIPISVFERIIKLSVPPNQYLNTIIIDPFCGSGSSAIACKNLGINYLGFEISTTYFNESIKSLSQSKKVIL